MSMTAESWPSRDKTGYIDMIGTVAYFPDFFTLMTAASLHGKCLLEQSPLCVLDDDSLHGRDHAGGHCIFGSNCRRK